MQLHGAIFFCSKEKAENQLQRQLLKNGLARDLYISHGAICLRAALLDASKCTYSIKLVLGIGFYFKKA